MNRGKIRYYKKTIEDPGKEYLENIKIGKKLMRSVEKGARMLDVERSFTFECVGSSFLYYIQRWVARHVEKKKKTGQKITRLNLELPAGE